MLGVDGETLLALVGKGEESPFRGRSLRQEVCDPL